MLLSKFFLCLHFWLFSYTVFWYNCIQIQPTWSFWASRICKSFSFPRFEMLSTIIVLNILSVSFSCFGISIMWILCLLVMSHKSHRLSSLFFIFFFLFVSLGNFQRFVFKVTDCFFRIVKAAFEAIYWGFLVQSMYCSALGFLGGFVYLFCFLFDGLYLLNFSYVMHVFLILFSLLAVHSCNSLNFFKRIFLNYWTVHGPLFL